MNEFLIELQAKLDEIKSQGNINKNIDSLQGELDELKLQATIDPKAAQKLADDIGKLINQKIVISNIGVDQSNLSKTGQQVGQVISDSAEKAIGNVSSKNIGKYFKVSSSDSRQFQAEMDKLVSGWTNGKGKVTDINIQTRTSYDQDAGKNIERLHQATVTYKNELDEVIKKTIAWRQIGTTTNTKGKKEILRGFVEVAGQYSKSIDTASAKTDNFVKKQKETVANMQNTINQITSRAFDSNSSRPITSDSSLEKLNTQVAYVENAMYDLRNATSTTFDDAKIKVQDEISQLKILEKELRNADNISNKMKGTDVTSGISIAKNDLEKFKADAKDFPQITQTIKDLDKAIASIGDASSLNKFNDDLRVARSELAKIKSETSATNRNEKVGIKVSGLESSITDLQRISPEIDKFETEIKGAKVTIQSLLTDLSKINTQGDFSVVNEKWNAFTKSAKSAGIAITEVATKSDSLTEKVKEIQLSMEGKNTKSKNYDYQIGIEIKKLKDLGFTDEEVTQKVKILTDAQTELKHVMNSSDFDSIVSKNKAIIEADKERTTALNQVRTAYGQLKNDASQYYNLNKQSKLSNDIQNWLSKNSSASKEAKESLNAYYRELSNGRVSVDRLNYIEKELKNIDATQRGLGKLGKNLKDQFAEAGKSFTQWLSVSSAVMLGVSKTKEAVSELIELDSILTEISKTSDLTTKQLKELGDNAFESASKYGRSAADYLTGVQEMYRAGFNNAEEMAELSLLAQAAGDMASNSANDYIMATNAAYNYKGSVEELNKVLDSQNYITNNAAVSMQDMADATSEAASIAAQYGVKIDELSALIAVATSKTRESGSEVGNALKSIFVTLQDTTSKPVIEAFDSVGISMTKIVNGAERLKTPIELLKELSDAFNELPEGDTKRANILTDIGKKYHANTLSAILSDWEAYESMLTLYSQGMGSASKEAEKSANNIEGSLKRLGNTWTDTVENVVNSDAILTVVNALNGLLSVVNKVTDALGSLGTIGLGAGLFAGLKNVGRPKMFGLIYC